MKALKGLFQNEDGTVSTSKVSAYLGVAIILHIWIDTRYIGLQYEVGLLEFWLEIIIIALGLRGVDRFSRYGLSNLGTLAGVKKKGAESEVGKADKVDKVDKAGRVTVARKNTRTTAAPVVPGGNFKLEEFDSGDGARLPAAAKRNIEVLIQQLEVIRQACGNRPIRISSGYRSPAHNAAQGGAPNSQHLQGKAADVKVKGMRPAQVRDVIKRLMDEGKIIPGGLKAYKTFTHYDTRGFYITWKN